MINVVPFPTPEDQPEEKQGSHRIEHVYGNVAVGDHETATDLPNEFQPFMMGEIDGGRQTVRVTVPEGTTPRDVFALMAKAGIELGAVVTAEQRSRAA